MQLLNCRLFQRYSAVLNNTSTAGTANIAIGKVEYSVFGVPHTLVVMNTNNIEQKFNPAPSILSFLKFTPL